jgi:hypothetical protein
VENRFRLPDEPRRDADAGDHRSETDSRRGRQSEPGVEEGIIGLMALDQRASDTGIHGRDQRTDDRRGDRNDAEIVGVEIRG